MVRTTVDSIHPLRQLGHSESYHLFVVKHVFFLDVSIKTWMETTTVVRLVPVRNTSHFQKLHWYRDVAASCKAFIRIWTTHQMTWSLIQRNATLVLIVMPITSEVFLAEISLRSPRKLFIFIIYKNIFRIKVSKKTFYLILKKTSLPITRLKTGHGPLGTRRQTLTTVVDNYLFITYVFMSIFIII